MNTSEKGRQIHSQAEHSREDGNFLDALKFTDEAMVAYQIDQDTAGFAEILASRFLTLRHLHEQTNDPNYLILAKHTVMASVEIAQKDSNQSALALPLFNLAKVQEDLNELPEAIESYTHAVEIMNTTPPKEHARPGVIADMQNHLAIAEYKNGDQSALQRALEAISLLEQTDEPKYNKDVWMSGGYLRLATATKDSKYLDTARVIIESNPELTLRKKQLEKISQDLK